MYMQQQENNEYKFVFETTEKEIILNPDEYKALCLYFGFREE